MENTKLKLELEVYDIKVEDGYFSFNYLYTINGDKKSATYGGDYDGYTERKFKKVLEKGYALEIALLQIAEDFEV